MLYQAGLWQRRKGRETGPLTVKHLGFLRRIASGNSLKSDTGIS